MKVNNKPYYAVPCMIVNINDEKKHWLKNVFYVTIFQNTLIIFGFHQSK